MDEESHIRITLRLPKRLYDQVEAAARESGRSVTAEINGRLEQSFAAGTPHDVGAELARMGAMLEALLGRATPDSPGMDADALIVAEAHERKRRATAKAAPRIMRADDDGRRSLGSAGSYVGTPVQGSEWSSSPRKTSRRSAASKTRHGAAKGREADPAPSRDVAPKR